MRLPEPVQAPMQAPIAWIGVDVGLSGGIAILSQHAPPQVHPMPLRKIDGVKVPCIIALRGIIREVRLGCRTVAAVEEPFLKGMQGGALTIGKNWGIVLAAFHLEDVPVTSVRPKDWQVVVLQGFVDPDPKVRAAGYVHAHYPDVPLLASKRSSVEHDGIIDALCIATWLKAQSGAEVPLGAVIQ